MEGVADLPAELLEPVVQGQDLLGEVRGDAGRGAPAWEGDALGLGAVRAVVAAASGRRAPGGEPTSEAGLPAPAQGGGGLTAGEQDEGALVVGVVEGCFQGRADAGEYVVDAVEQANPVGNQVGPVRGELGPQGPW